MTILIGFKGNGDLFVSCGGEQVSVPKEVLKRGLEENEALGFTFFKESGGSLPHLSGGAIHVTCDGVIVPRREDCVLVENVPDIKKGDGRSNA